MPSFGRNSKENLTQVDPRLVAIVERAIQWVDFSVVCGYRGKLEQDEAFNNKFSKVKWPNSAHNKVPSLAVDIIPYPTGYTDIAKFYELATYIFRAANELDIKIIWGGHWTSFKDYPHFELEKEGAV
jgi:peptidoglycan L-alanyl-D-glutamate endopeptidase CwlK